MKIDEQNIIAILGIESLPDDRKMAIINKVSELVQKRLMVRMIKSLDDKAGEEFAGLLEKNDPAAVQAFMGTHFPDFSKWMEEEVNAVKKELGEVAKV